MLDMPEAEVSAPTVNPLDTLLGYHLRRASVAMIADLSRRFTDLRLTLAEISVMQLIDANPLITQSEIGRMISIKRANMAPLAAGLMNRGLVVREAMDGRSQGLRMTDAGRAVLVAARKHMADNEALFFSRIPKSQRGAVVQALRALWDA